MRGSDNSDRCRLSKVLPQAKPKFTIHPQFRMAERMFCERFPQIIARFSERFPTFIYFVNGDCHFHSLLIYIANFRNPGEKVRSLTRKSISIADALMRLPRTSFFNHDMSSTLEPNDISIGYPTSF